MAITLLLERSVSIWPLLLLWARISRVARYADLAQARRGLPAQRQAQRQEVRPVPNRVVAAVNHWEGRSWEFFQRSLFGEQKLSEIWVKRWSMRSEERRVGKASRSRWS